MFAAPAATARMMIPDTPMRTACLVLVLMVALTLPGTALAETYEDAAELQRQTDEAARAHQQRIEALSDEATRMLEEYRLATQRQRRLQAYNQQLERLIESQEEEADSLRTQIEDVQLIEREIIPHMLDLLADLAWFVEQDLPFLPDERSERLQELRRMLDRADVSSAEKYRRLMEAYQIEAEYGRTLEAWRGTLGEGDERRTVEFLRVGRLILLYRSLDGSELARWDNAAGEWQPLPGRYHEAVDTAFRVARRQAPPELLVLPVPAPVAVDPAPVDAAAPGPRVEQAEDAP